MKITVPILGPFGWISQQPDGSIQSRPANSTPGLYELFSVEVPDPTPSQPLVQPLTPGLSYHQQFMAWVADKPFGQQTLLDLGPTLSAHGWRLEKSNTKGEVTKIYTPDDHVYRVGFGEEHWVWYLEYAPPG